MSKRDFLSEAIARELQRKASVSDRGLRRSAPRVSGLPEPQVAPSQPAWCFNDEVVKLMRALGYEWHVPSAPRCNLCAEPSCKGCKPKLKRDEKREAFRTDVSAACNLSFNFNPKPSEDE